MSSSGILFVRDKYAKKKCYDKNAIVITNKEKRGGTRKRKRERPAKPLTIDKLQQIEDQQLEL